jgi:hypothetical protein
VIIISRHLQQQTFQAQRAMTTLEHQNFQPELRPILLIRLCPIHDKTFTRVTLEWSHRNKCYSKMYLVINSEIYVPASFLGFLNLGQGEDQLEWDNGIILSDISLNELNVLLKHSC